MRKLKIALDCDGVLGDFTSAALRVVEEVTGKHFALEDVTEYDFTRALGLTPKEAATVKRVIGSRRGFATSILPYPPARQGVRRLRELGDVFCVTSPWDSNPWWREEREAWLALHFGIDHVHHAVDKSSYEADLFVDDRASHIAAWLTRWPGRAGVLWRTPHNTGEALPQGAHAARSWEDLYQLARRITLDPIQSPEVLQP